jgi:hypothetical protein
MPKIGSNKHTTLISANKYIKNKNVPSHSQILYMYKLFL